MTFIVTNGLKKSLLDSLFQDISSNRSRYYFCLGMPIQWPDDSNPPTPENNIWTETQARSVIVTSKKITPNDVVLLARRIDYEPNRVYDIFDNSVDLRDKDFYVINSEFSVFKCLGNNAGSVSTVEPFGAPIEPFETSDGYTWKYIYNIPPQLRSKFLSNDKFPVANSINSLYYSKGSINSISIKSAGQGYSQEATSLLVSGDGFQESNPFAVVDAIITNKGSGYTSATALIEPPYKNAVEFLAESEVLRGEIIEFENKYYRVTSGGILGITPPAFTSGEFPNGSATLLYIARSPDVEVNALPDVIGQIKPLDVGSGYQTTPLVTITGDGVDATATAVIDNGEIIGYTITNQGSGYTTATVTVDPPFEGAILYSSGVLVESGNYVEWAGNYYFVVTGGELGASAPIHTTGQESNGTAILEFAGRRAEAEAILGNISSVILRGFVNDIQISNKGSGYTTAEVIIDGDGSGAVGNAVIEDGEITSIIITNQGSGYTTANVTVNGDGTGFVGSVSVFKSFGYGFTPTLTFSPPQDVRGRLAAASISVQKTEAILRPVIMDGQLVGVDIVDGGIAYTNAKLTVAGDGFGAEAEVFLNNSVPNSAQTNSELFATPESISGIVVEDRGSNISNITLTIVGDGVGATAEAVLSNGGVEAVRVTSEGTGYTFAYITVAVNAGAVEPQFRIILSPPKGHGSDPANELYASAIGFYGAFSNDLNQGLIVENDQRQVSILRNPLRFNEERLLESPNASTLFKAVVTYSTPNPTIERDELLERESDGSRFRLIEKVDNEILLQEIDNSTPEVGDRLILSTPTNTLTITISQIVRPQLDKYSGELLFINNVRPFVVSPNQAVTIRSIISL